MTRECSGSSSSDESVLLGDVIINVQWTSTMAGGQSVGIIYMAKFLVMAAGER